MTTFKDVVIGIHEFHRDDDGNVTVIERQPGRTEIAVVPREVWVAALEQLESEP